MVWVSLSLVAPLTGLLVFASFSPVILLSGLSPIILLLLCYCRTRTSGDIPNWPDQCVVPAALSVLSACMFLRYEMSQHLVEIGLVKSPAPYLWLLWVASALCGMASILYIRECWSSAGAFVIYTVLSMVCFYTAYAMLDVQLDGRAAMSVRSVRVVGKVVKSNGRTAHGTLTLAINGDYDLPSEYTGNWNLYQALAVGDSICFSEYGGALGTPWRKVSACSSKSP